MQFSKNWLNDFIDIDLSTEDICAQLTMAGLEVDGFENINSKITGKDSIIKLDITPNRGDCFSVLGVARELAVINSLKLRLPEISSVEDSFKDNVQVKVCPEGPSYYGRTLKNLSLDSKTDPLISERLRLSDQKLIDPVVDITNYILLELGQPLHAFDRDKLKGNISVRTAKNKEKIVLLDDQILELDSSCLVIADDKGAVAFAGIMGGKESAVSTSTKSIFLESAYFKPSAIRGKARRFGFQTDASLRFERGVDYKIQELALERASMLLRKTLGGEFSSVTFSSLKKYFPKHQPIKLDLERSNKILGTNISKKSAIQYLEGLGFSPDASKKEIISAVSPSWRYDINIEADLVEELARLEGYDSLPLKSLVPVYKKAKTDNANHLTQELVSKGFNEIISYSFIGEQDHLLFGQGVKTLEVENPISQNMTIMRTNLLSGLVNTFIYNLNHGQESQKLFEVGNIFNIDNAKKVKEKKVLAGLMSGNVSQSTWKSKPNDISFYDLKGVVQDLLSKAEGSYSYVECDVDFLHPGMSSYIKHKNKVIGLLGSLHPAHIDTLGLKKDVFIFSIELMHLNFDSSNTYRQFSKYPSTSRDLAFIVDKSVNAGDLERIIKSSAGKSLKEIEIFDVYEGQGIDDDKKSLALSITWQSLKTTLKDSDIDNAVTKIVNSVKNEFDGELRV